jgi:hypothetical protein
MAINTLLPGTRFGTTPKPKWTAPSEADLVQQVTRAMRLDYGQDTFARFQDIMRTERDEHRNGEQRIAGKPMRHEKVAMQKGLEDPKVALFNKFVIQAVMARGLVKDATPLPSKVKETAENYAGLIARMPGGPAILAAQMNQALGLFRKGLEQAMRETGNAG